MFVCVSFFNNELLILISLLIFFVGTTVSLLVSFILAKSIKSIPDKKTLKFYEFSVSNKINFSEKMDRYGSIVRYSGKEQYVSFSTNDNLLSNNLVVIAKIEVDKNYTQKDYSAFMNSIAQLTQEGREINDDFTYYPHEIRLIIFVEKESCEFVAKYLKRQLPFFRKIKTNAICVFCEKTSKVKLLRVSGCCLSFVKKYFNEIFEVNSSPIKTKENAIEGTLEDFIDPLNREPHIFTRV